MVAYDSVENLAYVEGGSENKPGHKKFVGYRLPDWVRHPLKKQPQRLALLFPGEQNHYVGMLKEVRKKPAVKKMLATAEAIFGFDVESLMKDGPAADMKPTSVNQPIMYVANCVAYEMLKERRPEEALECQAVAGYSVGEYSALYAAGVITFEQGCEIVKARADAMQELSDEVEMEALSVRGLPLDKFEKMMKNATKQDSDQGGEPEIHIARYWCPDGFVFAGKRSTVLKLQELVKMDRDADKAEVRLLPDHLPAAHTPMASQAEEAVVAVLDRLIPAMNPPRCEVFLNSTGWRVPAGTSPFEFANSLKTQLSEPLLWESIVTQLMRWGIKNYIECGPMRSLRYMMGFFEQFREAPTELIKPGDSTTNVLV